jgi:hypothetical protein
MPRLHPLVLCAAFLALAACSGQSGVSGTGSPGGTPILAGFVPNSGNLLQVMVEDRSPVEQVELIGPDGRVYVAQTVTRDPIIYDQDRYGYTRGYPPGYYQSPLNVGVGGFSTSTGHSGVGLGFGLGFAGNGYDTVQREVAVKSIAQIAVADMAYYTETWQQWRARIRLAEPGGGARYIEIPAPQPPTVSALPPAAAPPG